MQLNLVGNQSLVRAVLRLDHFYHQLYLIEKQTF